MEFWRRTADREWCSRLQSHWKGNLNFVVQQCHVGKLTGVRTIQAQSIPIIMQHKDTARRHRASSLRTELGSTSMVGHFWPTLPGATLQGRVHFLTPRMDRATVRRRMDLGTEPCRKQWHSTNGQASSLVLPYSRYFALACLRRSADLYVSLRGLIDAHSFLLTRARAGKKKWVGFTGQTPV